MGGRSAFLLRLSRSLAVGLQGNTQAFTMKEFSLTANNRRYSLSPKFCYEADVTNEEPKGKS